MFNKDNLLKQMESGSYPTHTVKTDVGAFVVKYPTGDDNLKIANMMSIALGGRPANSFPMGYVNGVVRDMTLSVVTTEYPKEFPKKWREDFLNYPIEEVKNDIHKSFLEFCKDVKDKLYPSRSDGDAKG